MEILWIQVISKSCWVKNIIDVCLYPQPLGWAYSSWRFLGPQSGLLFLFELKPARKDSGDPTRHEFQKESISKPRSKVEGEPLCHQPLTLTCKKILSKIVFAKKGLDQEKFEDTFQTFTYPQDSFRHTKTSFRHLSVTFRKSRQLYVKL